MPSIHKITFKGESSNLLQNLSSVQTAPSEQKPAEKPAQIQAETPAPQKPLEKDSFQHSSSFVKLDSSSGSSSLK